MTWRVWTFNRLRGELEMWPYLRGLKTVRGLMREKLLALALRRGERVDGGLAGVLECAFERYGECWVLVWRAGGGYFVERRYFSGWRSLGSLWDYERRHGRRLVAVLWLCLDVIELVRRLGVRRDG